MICAIALDLGSTSIKAGLLLTDGSLVNIVAQAVPAVNSNNGRYESDALAYAEITDQVLNACLKFTHALPPLGLCSQRSSFLIWEKASGKPLTPLISWQDNRGEQSCIDLKSKEPSITQLTGLRLTPYFFAPKLRLVLKENPHWLERLLSGELLVGTLDIFLIWRWTGGKQFITDVSMAARTLLMDIREQKWSPLLCDTFAIPLKVLPEIKPSTGLNISLDNGLILQASLGDQSAALVASVGEDSEIALVNLGTGGFVIRYLSENIHGNDGYLRTLVYQDLIHEAHIAIEGTLNSIATALAAYPVTNCTVEGLAACSDIYCLAEPSGLGAPYFRTDIRLQFSNDVSHLTQTEVACLLLESIIFRVVRILEEFNLKAGIKRVYLSGGLSELAVLQQGIALCVPFSVFRLNQKEASMQGAAILAADMEQVPQELERIQVDFKNSRLTEKYVRWKHWLDTVLQQQQHEGQTG
jgi:glycerol kinase